jgi:hypothetical protein
MYGGAQNRCTAEGKIECIHRRLRIGVAPVFPSRGSRIQSRKEVIMLYTIAVVLLILWLLGLVSSYTLGGFIHVLLVIAIVVVLFRVISGRSVI